MDETAQYRIDSIMLSSLAQGNEEAFAKFVHIMYKKLFPFTVSLIKSAAEADDILQEVFVKVWLNRSSLAAVDNPLAWMHKVAANTTSNHLRSKLRRELSIKELGKQITATEEIEEVIDAKFTQTLVEEAVGQLPAKRKLVFLMSKKEGLSRREIAAKLQISENTVRNQLSEAVKFIHDYLGQKGNPILPLLFFSPYFF